MGVETLVAIGTALGVGGSTTGAAVTGAAVLGAAAYGATEAVKGIAKSGKSPSAPNLQKPSGNTGKLKTEEAQDIARKKLFRTGSIFTTPTGVLGKSSTTSSGRLK